MQIILATLIVLAIWLASFAARTAIVNKKLLLANKHLKQCELAIKFFAAEDGMHTPGVINFYIEEQIGLYEVCEYVYVRDLKTGGWRPYRCRIKVFPKRNDPDFARREAEDLLDKLQEASIGYD